jgi:hypothetical protein
MIPGEDSHRRGQAYQTFREAVRVPRRPSLQLASITIANYDVDPDDILEHFSRRISNLKNLPYVES